MNEKHLKTFGWNFEGYAIFDILEPPFFGCLKNFVVVFVCLCLYLCYYKMIRNPLLFENVAYFESLKHLVVVSVFVSVYVFVSVSVSVFFMYLSCLCPHMCRKINQNEKKIKNMHKWKSMNRLRAKSLMPEVNLTPGCLKSPSNFQISGRKETLRMFAFISRGDNFLQGHSMFCE